MKSSNLLTLSLLCNAALLHTAGCAVAADAPGAQKAAPIPAVTEKPGDKYMLPGGAGNKDGSSWANALDAAAGLQSGWDALKPGQTLWLGSGNYPGARLRISAGGEAGKLKTIAGKDTGGGAPIFTSDFNKNNPGKSGATFITLSDGADYWQVQDIHVRDYKLGIASSAGGHQGGRIRNFDVTGCREGIVFIGGATAERPELGTHDIDVSDCEFTNFTKRGIRLRNGNYDIRITNCVADAGGKEWATEPFHMGFSVEGDDDARKSKKPGAHDHDITYTNCVALNSYHNNGNGYWNADGFCGERGVNNIRFINCKAFDNTDGGWDFKAENVTLEGCVAVGNKRNYRFWGKTTKLINCLAASSVWPGGSGGDTGLWTNGNVTVEKSTFFDSGFSIDAPGTITVTDSLYVRTKDRPGTTPLGEKDGLKLVNTILWDENTAQGENPQFIKPAALWEGQGDAFNNKKFGPAKGFANDPTAITLNFRRAHPLELGKKGAEVKTVAAEIPAPKVPKTAEQIALEAKMVPIVENGSFEEDLKGWTKASAPAYTIANIGAPEGQKYVTVLSTGNRIEVKNKISGLVAGETYTLSFRSRGNTAKQARIIVRETPKSSYLGSTVPADSKEWTAKTVKFKAPASEIVMEISVRSAGTFDMDDFVVKRVN